MFELIFGIFFELITLPIYFMFMFDNTGSPRWLTFVFPLFIAIGFVMIIKGVVEIVRNIKTSKLGEEAYGRVVNIKGNGQYLNDAPILVADVKVYVKSLNQVIDCSEEVGIGMPKYDMGEYVKVKYYNKDINFIEKVDVNSIPLDIKNFIFEEAPVKSDVPEEVHQGPIVYFESEDIVIVDGVKYKRISE